MSYTQVNHDLTGLRLLQTVADVDKLHNLATCVVNYKGHRIICQTIVPGILNNNDLSKLAEYGPVEERKNYKISEEFHGLMKQVAESLSIKTVKVVDPGEKKTVEVAGSSDCRGIRGTDRRCYLVEMQSLLPRDANMLGDNA
jgi:protein TIF31